jgi:hypothetical protein
MFGMRGQRSVFFVHRRGDIVVVAVDGVLVCIITPLI